MLQVVWVTVCGVSFRRWCGGVINRWARTVAPRHISPDVWGESSGVFLNWVGIIHVSLIVVISICTWKVYPTVVSVVLVNAETWGR